MTIGIYALDFSGNFYIGRSNNIERRFNDHLSNLVKGISNNKVLEAYRIYGPPSLVILEVCSENDLGIKEQSWIEEFNSTIDGQNITSGGDGGGYGVHHNRAIHSKEKILEVFKLLIDDLAIPYTEISSITNVSVSTITNIKEQYQHRWIEQEFPELYLKLADSTLNNKRRINSDILKAKILTESKKLGHCYPSIICPKGIVYKNIKCAKTFADTHGLTREGLCRLFSGKIQTHRKWKLYNEKISLSSINQYCVIGQCSNGRDALRRFFYL